MIVASLIVAWFVVVCFYVDWDIREECSFQVGADGSCPDGLTSDEPSRADNPRVVKTIIGVPRDYLVAHRPYDWAAERSSPVSAFCSARPEEGSTL